MPTSDAVIAAGRPPLLIVGLATASAVQALRQRLAGHSRVLLPLILIVRVPAACVLTLMAVPGIRGE